MWVGLSAQPAAAEKSIAVQADGGIVLAGQLNQPQHSCGPVVFRRECRLYSRAWPALVKLKPDGSLDAGFGTGGGVIDFRGSPQGGSFGTLALDQGAGILVAGSWSDFLRFGGEKGNPNPNFQGAGLVPTAILPQLDGSLIVTTADQVGIKESHSSLTVSRVGPAGKPPETIGSVEGTSLGDAVAIREFLQLGDSLLAAGRVGFAGAVLRFRLGGEPGVDSGFAAGKGILRPGGEVEPWVAVSSIAADGDGFLIAGERKLEEPVVARYDSDGVLDSSFGEGGTIRLLQAPIRSEPAVLIVGTGGRITVVGQRHAACPNPRPHARSATVACAKAFVQRIEPGGAVGSAVDLPLPSRGSIDAVALGDGGLLVSRMVRAGAATRFAIARLESDGGLDPAFGTGGVAEVAPCRGPIRARRRAGCIGSTRPGLRLAGLAGRRPHGQLRVVDRNQLDPIVAVRLLLPAEIRAVPPASRAVRVVTVPRRKDSVKIADDRIVAYIRGDAVGLSIGLRPGVLRRVASVGAGHKLVIGVITTFKDGSSQRSAIRLAPR